MLDPDQITADSFFQGRLLVHQSRGDYRFSIDAVLVANSFVPKSGQSIVDLGTGCGIIPLILAYRFASVSVIGMEVQPALAQLAVMNVRVNGLQDRIRIVQKDIRQVQAARTIGLDGPVDWVVANPPYRQAASGRINPDDRKALARHEISLTLPQLIQAGSRLLRTRGRFVAIYPAERLSDVFLAMRQAAIEPKWLQGVHSRQRQAARLVLVQGVKAGRPGLTFAPPLYIYQEDGGYTPAVQAMFERNSERIPFSLAEGSHSLLRG